jgi:membrane-associated protease RseP (regulator of RpoE activity)
MIENLLYVGGIILMLLGIAISIGWHELGHLIPAKLFGVRVPQYMIGFGPTIWSKKRGETEYGIKLIPLGGYISMIGMFLPEKTSSAAKKRTFLGGLIADARPKPEDLLPGDENRQFYNLSPLKRIAIMFGGPFMNLVLGFVLMLLVFSGFGLPGPSNKVLDIIECVPTKAASTSLCSDGDAPSPAKLAGLQAGDQVLAVNGTPVSSWLEVKPFFSSGETLSLSVKRDAELISLNLKPALLENPVLDQSGAVALAAGAFVGVRLENAVIHHSISSVVAMSADNVAGVFKMLVNLPIDITNTIKTSINGGERDANGPVSIVGITNLAGEVAANPDGSAQGKLTFGLLMLASLNFALFAFNMIPLLPLDGGHILGAIYESIKRALFRLFKKPDPGPIDSAKLVPLTWLVFIVLFALSAVLIFADFVNPISLNSQ